MIYIEGQYLKQTSRYSLLNWKCLFLSCFSIFTLYGGSPVLENE